MNYIITVINPEAQDLMTAICNELHLPMTDIIYGEGTADDSIRSMLGIDYPHEKRIITTIADEETTDKLKKALKQYMDLDAPGHGVMAAVPVRSVGGKSTLAYLNQNKAEAKKAPVLDDEHELIMCICNHGCTDQVMPAARRAGARGGTVLHAKGTGSKETAQFYNVTISSEKEVIMMIVQRSRRNEIMQAVLKEAGPDTPAGAICFSLPLTAAAGLDEDNI